MTNKPQVSKCCQAEIKNNWDNFYNPVSCSKCGNPFVPKEEKKCCEKCWHINLAHTTSKNYCVDRRCKCHKPPQEVNKDYCRGCNICVQESGFTTGTDCLKNRECECHYPNPSGNLFTSQLNPSLPQESWKERFDEKFNHDLKKIHWSDYVIQEEIKAFILQIESDAYERGVTDSDKMKGGRGRIMYGQGIEEGRTNVLTLLKSEVDSLKKGKRAYYGRETSYEMENKNGYHEAIDEVLSLLSNHETKNNG